MIDRQNKLIIRQLFYINYIK